MSRSCIGGYRNGLTVTEAADELDRLPGTDEPPRAIVPEAAGALGSCPACAGPLYRWLEAPSADARIKDTFVLDRCEGCGLGIVHEGVLDLSAIIESGSPRRDGAVDIGVPNRRSLQATIGEGTWAALRLPVGQAVFTPGALAAALERRGYSVERTRQPLFGPNLLWMWQTLMNAVTLHPNFLREWLAGRLDSSNGRGGAAFGLDLVVSFFAAPFVAVIAIPLELASAALRRGGLLVARVSRSEQTEN